MTPGPFDADGAGGGAAAEAMAAALVVSVPAEVGVEGGIVQAIAARRNSTAPRAGSHIGVLGSGKGWS